MHRFIRWAAASRCTWNAFCYLADIVEHSIESRLACLRFTIFFLSPGQNHFKRSAKFSVRSFSLDERQGKQIYSVLKRLIIFIFIVSARAQCKVVYIRHLCLISFVDKTIYTNRVTAETHQNTCKRFSICSWQLIIISWHSNPIQSVNQKYKWMKEIYNIWALFTIFRSNRKCCIFIYNECSCLDWFGSVR